VSPAASFAIATPASWYELDLNAATRLKSIGGMLARSAGHLDASARDQLAQLLARSAADAQAQGAVMAAIYSDVLEGRPVSASLVASVKQGKDEPGPRALTPSRVAETLFRGLAGAGFVEMRDLPAGRAVRLRKRIQAPVPGQEVDVEVENVQWFVPLPDGRQLALLAFSTPSLGLTEPFGELFDAIAGTLRWT
jgi:hypothetical protein